MKRSRVIWVCIFPVFAELILSAWLLRKWNRLDRLLRKKERFLSDSRQEIREQLSEDMGALRERHDCLMGELEMQKSQNLLLAQEHEVWKRMLVEKTPVLHHICQDVLVHELEPGEWEEFKKIFRKMHPHFAEMLAESCPDMAEVEILTCYLLKLGIRTSRIAALLGQKENTVSKRKKHILAAHFNVSGSQSLDNLLESWH